MKKLFDVNLSTGRWPFRRLPLEKLSDLSVRLRAAGISGGLVRSLEAPFSMNVYEANDLLLESCRNHPELIPAPSVRPDFTLWREIDARAVALHPVCHQYSLEAPETLEMIEALLGKKILPVIVIREEDERGQHPLCRVAPVAVDEINSLARRFPEHPFLVLNAYAGEIGHLDAPNLYADIAFAETFPALSHAVEKFGTERLVFGSHAPFFCLESELSKLEYGKLTEEQRTSIAGENIGRIFGNDK